MQFIDLNTQTQRIEDKLVNRFKSVLTHGNFIMGPEVLELELALAEFVGVGHAIGVSSGTDALLIALMALNIAPGDEIITTPFSFFATAEVIALLGAKVVFVDIDRETYNIDPQKIESVISKKTKAIIPVSLYGQCADIDAINDIANRYSLAVIEDAAQSFGAKYKGRYSGGLTTIGCTSFFPSKPLGCYGDGGACFTNDIDLARRMKEIRVHGQSKRYYHTSIGVNARLDTVQAAFLLEKLEIFKEECELRLKVAENYSKKLPQWIKKPIIKPENTSVFAQYTIEVPNRKEVQEILNSKNIPTAVHYPICLHQQPVFKEKDLHMGIFPNAEEASRLVMSLPMHPYLSESDQDLVVSALESAFEGAFEGALA